MPKLCAAFVILFGVCGVAEALAGPDAEVLELEWRAPAACPSEADIRDDVVRLVGDIEHDSAELVADARVERKGDGSWRLFLTTELDGTAGERELEGESCEAVARAAAVMLALMLNPNANPDEPRKSAPEAAPWTLGVEAHVNVASGVLPEFAPGVALGVVAGVGRTWGWLGAGTSLPSRAELAGDPTRGGQLWLADLRGGLCWELLGETSTVGGCGLVRVHRLEGRGTGIANPRTGVVWWTDAGVAVVGRAALTESLTLQGYLAGALPLTRPALFVERLGVVQRPDTFDGSVGLGGLFHFR